MPFDILKLAVREAGTPTQGELAAAIWSWLSSSCGPAASDAAKIYRELGYKPFEGYPLVRLPKS